MWLLKMTEQGIAGEGIIRFFDRDRASAEAQKLANSEGYPVAAVNSIYESGAIKRQEILAVKFPR